MANIHSLMDLGKYGIHALTGEACALNLRVLCDYDERGLALLREWFGARDFRGSEPWNTSTGGHTHVGSVMLTRCAHMELGVLALLNAGLPSVYTLEYRMSVVGVLRQVRAANARVLDSLADPSDRVKRQNAIDEIVAANSWVPMAVSASLGLNEMTVYGFEEGREESASEFVYQAEKACWRVMRHGRPTAAFGSRNQHQMSGRVV